MRLKKNFVPNSVVPSCPYAVVVAAVHRMVAVDVFIVIAVIGRTRPRLDEMDAEAIAHYRGE